MESSLFNEDEEGAELFRDAKDLIARGDHTKALEILEDLLSVYAQEEGSSLLHCEEARIFSKLSRESATAENNPNLAFTYLLASVSCLAEDVRLTRRCAEGLHELAQRLGSVLYYKECVRVGKQGLYVSHLEEKMRKRLVFMIKDSEFMISRSKSESIRNDELKFVESKEPVKDEVNKGLKLFWKGLDVKLKREFMKVSIEKLRGFVERRHNSEGLKALEKVVAYAREHKKWTTWVCRTMCLADFSNAEECKAHLEEEHGAEFKPCSDIVTRIRGKWADKIKVGPWEALDTVAAVEMIKTQLADVKAFTLKSRKKGWSNQWPLAADEKRSSLLKEIKLLLVSLCEHQILSCSIRDWLMYFPVKHLEELEVSEQRIFDCHIVETPQSICFLERYELSQIRAFLKNIKCERHDGTEQVCRAVDSVLDSIRVKESIEFDEQFSLLLLDKRLLKSNINAPLGGDDGKIHFIADPDVHYAKAQVKGDDIMSWLGDCSSVDKSFPKPIREHNLVIWVAVLRAVQYTCRALRSKYAKKELVLEYEAALTFVTNLCMLEDERRNTAQDDQKNSYASLLCKRCEERVTENSLTAKLFLCAVRNVFEGGCALTFDLEDCMSFIREGSKRLEDEIVLKSIELLKSLGPKRVLLIDAKILLIDNSRISLLDKLTRLSAFDNRSYMLQLLKPFLLSKAKSDAAEADLLLEEEKMSQAKKKKKTSKSIKRTSTSTSTPVEQKPSIDLKPGGTSQSLKTMEEDSMEPKDTKLNTGDMQNKPGEDSLSGHLESALEGTATKYNSSPDMTLKNEIVIVKSKERKKSLKGKKKSQPKKTKKDQSIKGQQVTSTSMASPVEQKPSVDLEPGGTSQSPETMEEDSMEPEVTLITEKGPLEISTTNDIQEEATKVNSGGKQRDMQNMPGEGSVSGNLESALGGAVARYSSALDMTLKALVSINVLKEQVLKYNKQPCHDNLEEQVLCALQSLFTAAVSEEIQTEGVSSLILRDLLVSLEEVNSMSSAAAEVLVTILEFWHCWKNLERESLVTRLFTLEENERMSCRECRRQPNYPDQSSYGIVIAADSIRNLKCAFGDIKFVDILKMTRMKYNMLCDTKTGGCGTTNVVHHVISKCPPIFTIVLEWEKRETEKEIYETIKALEWEIDISRLYKGLEPNTNYRLVSMVGCSEEGHICIAYENNRWVNLRRDSLAGEAVGSWKSVVRYCGERKIRPEILFYEAAPSMMT